MTNILSSIRRLKISNHLLSKGPVKMHPRQDHKSFMKFSLILAARQNFAGFNWMHRLHLFSNMSDGVLKSRNFVIIKLIFF